MSIDGDDDTHAPGMSDIDDLLDDELPISIPDATYVLKRDDFQEASAAVGFANFSVISFQFV